ncbi:MAG: UDP-N-acetylglucosamine 2-epimerase (non-hydrolyzing) [Candidatus Omnitrophota bacterium]
MKIINVVGARPNYMKVAPIIREMKRYRSITPILVHTGQHYDWNMSEAFFRDLAMPDPDIHLEVGSCARVAQIEKIRERFDRVLEKEKPDLILVVGDVNSTLACAQSAHESGIRVAHVEAGLRSFDMTMPEEINRIKTDKISDFLFTTCEGADWNLAQEGIDAKKIFFVGNVMVDSLFNSINKIESNRPTGQWFDKLTISRTIPSGVEGPANWPTDYAVVTLHRPSNVDNKDVFERISQALKKIAEDIPVIFPVHPRTKKQIDAFGFDRYYEDNITLADPMGYLDFLRLYSAARFVMTDSGGIQEETTVLDIPCLTIRENTERPITIERGTNILVGTVRDAIVREARKILRGDRKRKQELKYWDGAAAERIVKVLMGKLV